MVRSDRGYIENSPTDEHLVRDVLRIVVCLYRLAEASLHLTLLGAKLPIKTRVNIGVEANRHNLVRDRYWASNGVGPLCSSP